MANESVDAVAIASDIRPFPGDSFSDQVLGYTAMSSPHSKPPIGLPVGSAIGGAFLLAVTAILSVYTHRQRKQNRLHKVRTLLRCVIGPVPCSLLHRMHTALSQGAPVLSEGLLRSAKPHCMPI